MILINQIIQPKINEVSLGIIQIITIVIEIVLIVNLTGRLTDLNAVIVPGMSMVLTVQTLKQTITGIALVVHAQVMVIQFVEMDLVTVMKPMKHAQMIVTLLANVMLVIYPIVLMTIAAQNLGLVMALLNVKIRLKAVI